MTATTGGCPWCGGRMKIRTRGGDEVSARCLSRECRAEQEGGCRPAPLRRLFPDNADTITDWAMKLRAWSSVSRVSVASDESGSTTRQKSRPNVAIERVHT
jgi:hypothetical protein